MKTKLITLLVVFAFSSVFTSCDKDEVKIASMSATVDGALWESTLAAVVGKKYSGTISVLGYNLAGNKIFLMVKTDEVTTGTFNIALNPFNGNDGSLVLPTVATYGQYMANKDEADEEAATNYYSTSGSVIISEVDEDNKITGTFSFTAVNKSAESIEITGGKFEHVKIL